MRDWGADGAFLELPTGGVMGCCAVVVGAIAGASCWELDAWEDIMRRLDEKVNPGDGERRWMVE